jgi:hypothetical protein
MWFVREGSPAWLRRKIKRLPEAAPITLEFEAAIVARNERKKDPWYGSQKEHWLGWLREYNGPGFYGRMSWDVGAKEVYNRVVNPAMLVWLAEASGVDESDLRRAIGATLDVPNNMPAQSGCFRRHISWEMIEERLRST